MPKLCVIPGDGIGQEVIPAAVSVLQTVVPDLEIEAAEAGWDCFLRRGVSVPAGMAARSSRPNWLNSARRGRAAFSQKMPSG